MAKIYTSMSDFERAQENEFRSKVTQISNLGVKPEERLTLDREWTEQELKEDLLDEAEKLLNGKDKIKGWIEKHKYRVLKDETLIHSEFLVNKIMEENDLIEIYNKAYDKHRNDKPRKFGIVYYDEELNKIMTKILNDNLLT